MSFNLQEILDVDKLRKLFQDFYKVTGFPVGLIDAWGNVLIETSWQRICKEFHRKHPQSLANCRESDQTIQDRLKDGTAQAYRCRNGLIDVAVPIEVNGRHVASLFFGQFFWKEDPPDEFTFRKQAREYGYNEEEYLKALREVKFYSSEEVEKLLMFCKSLINYIVELAREKQQVNKEVEKREKLEKKVERDAELRKLNILLQKEIQDKAAIEEELRASNEQLQSEIVERSAIEEELRATNDQLTEEIEQRRQTHKKNEQLIYELGERMKEMACLNKVNKLTDNQQLTIKDILYKTAELIPRSWDNPEATFCRITYLDQIFYSKNFKETNISDTKILYRGGKDVGKIEIFVETGAETKEKAFLEEEFQLLDNIAIALSGKITREFTYRQLKINAQAVHNSATAFTLGDLNGKILEANPVFAKTWGYKFPEEIENKNMADLLADNRDTEKILYALQTKGIWRSETLGVKKDGAVFNIAVSASVVIDDNGDPIAITSTFVDITERKRSEAAIKESEKRYRILSQNLNGIIENKDVSIWSVDKDYKILAINSYFKQYYKQAFGIDLKAGDNIVEKIPEEIPGLRQMWINRYNRAFRGENFKDEDKYVVGGEQRYFEVSLNPIKDNEKMTGAVVFASDITDWKKADLEIKEKEEKFRHLFEAVPDAVLIADPGTGILTNANQAAAKLLKKPVDQIIGMHQSELHPVDEREATAKKFQEIAQRGSGQSQQVNLIDSEGAIKPVEIRGSVFQLKGKPVAVGLFRDISDRVEAENKLKASEEQHRKIFEAVTDTIFICDMDGKIVEANPAATRQYGYSHKEFIGMNPLKLVHPDWHHEFERFLKTVTRGETFFGETIDLTKDNKPINSQVIGTTLVFNGKKHVMAVIRDITELKKARQDVERFFDVTLDLLCIAGTDGYFKKLNPSWEKILGYSEQELMSRPFVEFVHPDDVEDTIRETKKLAEGNVTVNFINRYRCKDGAYRWLNWNTTPYGDILYAAALDITELKEAENELKNLLVELERSNKDLEQFAYIASHDLQEPLRMVSSFLQLIDKRYSAQLDDEGREFIGYAVDGSNRMKALINDLLKYSRVGTRGKPFEPVDLKAVVKNTLRYLAPAIDESNARITFGNLPVIDADEMQIAQVFQNLLSNAIKFRSNKTPEISIGAKEYKKHWKFTVKDNGIGIDEQFFERIFIIFQRLHSKDKYGGTGIGLAVCKKIVERHHGTIGVKSNKNGSEFFFYIEKNLSKYNG